MIPVSPKLLAIGALSLAIAGGMGYLWVQWKSAEAEVSQVQADKQKVEADRDQAIEANKSNMDTIDKLQEEKRLIGESLQKLQQDQERNQQVIANMSAAIKKQAADPANRVPLSPVLKETVQSVQAQRAQRSGEVK